MERPSSRRELRLDLPDCAPEVRLLEASAAELGEPELRSWAQELTLSAGAEGRSLYSSRSYRFPYALVSAHTAPVGVDIERIEALEPGFASSISTPDELDHAAPLDREHATSLWSSKEALAKALGDALDYDPRRLGSPIFWPEGRSGSWRALRLPVPSGHVGWVCWRADAPGPQVL